MKDQLDFILETMGSLKNGEIKTYEMHDEEENYVEFVGFDKETNNFYVRLISDGEETKTPVVFSNALSKFDQIFRKGGIM